MARKKITRDARGCYKTVRNGYERTICRGGSAYLPKCAKEHGESARRSCAQKHAQRTARQTRAIANFKKRGKRLWNTSLTTLVNACGGGTLKKLRTKIMRGEC